MLYETGFESSETPSFAAGVGTTGSPKLVGTGNWTMVVNPTSITTSTCYPFAGIDSDLVPGMDQTAALGYPGSTAPPSSTQFIRVGRKVTTEPVVAGSLPIIDFYCQIGLTQSTNSRHDDLELLVYNWDDKILGGLTFDLTQSELFRYDANEYNTGSTDSPYTDTGLSLSSIYGTVVEVTMRVNYRTNTWTASVGGVQVVSGATFTRRPTTTGTSPAARTFGSVQARWYITTVGYPSNSWMLFDDWSMSGNTEATIPATASAAYAPNSTAAIAVTDTASVGWSVTSDQTWAVVSPTSGTGSGTITVTCAANPNTTARTATITVGVQTCILTQAAAPATTSIPPTASASYAANSVASIAVTSNTTWTATSDHVWAVVGSPASGSGNGTVTVTCTLNAAATSRTAVITVGTQTSVLTQAASPFAVWAAALPQNAQGFSQDADHDGVSNGMEYAFGRDATSPSGINGVAQLPVVTVAGSGSLHHLTLTLSLPEPAPADIVYDIQAANGLTGTWTVIMEKIGTAPWTALGNSGATVVLAPNGSGRTSCAITDAQGYRFMRLAVTSSSAAAPVTTIPATASALYATNSTATIPVTSNTIWTASSDQAWAVVSPTSGSGNAAVTVTCAANAAATTRTAVITIGSQTCVLTQAAWPYAIWAAGLTQGSQGFAMDADHDGVSNGMEYALGRNGASASGVNGMAQLPVITTVGSGTSQNLSMSLNLPDPAPVDIVYDVQVANGLTGQWINIMEKSGTGSWSALGNSGATLSSSPAGSGRTTYTITDVQGRHFMRLAVKSL